MEILLIKSGGIIKMKILFDNQIFEKQKYGGISRYFSEILKYISNTNNFKYARSENT